MKGKIKSFKEVIKIISESLDSPIEVKWNKLQYIWEGIFYTENSEYTILIEEQKYNIWKYKFFHVKNDKLSVKKTNYNCDTFRVLSTVYKSAFDFLKEINPNGIIFGADNDSSSRVKLYTKFSNECAKKFGYKLHEFPKGNERINPTIFVLYHKLESEELFDVIKIVIDSEIGIN